MKKIGNKDYPECSGCSINDICVLVPKITLEGYEIECPCRLCLIKFMCVHHCEHFRWYSRDCFKVKKVKPSGKLIHEAI